MTDSNFVTQLAQKLREIGAVHALGEQWISCDGTIPAGGVPFCGQTVQRSLYADLFAWAQAQGRVKTESEWQELAAAQGGNCAYYSDGDGSTTFRMPAVVSYLRGSASAGAAGTFVEEGLPNAKGNFSVWGYASEAWTNPNHNSGPFFADENASANAKTYGEATATTGRKYGLTMDLSRASSIFGNSEHVTPRTSCVLVGVYAVSVLTNTASADVAQIQTALAALESEVGALPSPTAYITQAWTSDDGLSWYRKWSDGWIEQGGVYQKPENGGGSLDTITFPISFANTEYMFFRSSQQTGNNTLFTPFVAAWKTKEVQSVSLYVDSYANMRSVDWYACGF